MAAAITAALLGAGGLAFAFVELTSDDGPVPTPTTATTAPANTSTAAPTTATETTGGTGAQP